MKLTKISLLLACPFTLAICAGHVKADSVTTATNPDTTLVTAQSTDSMVPNIATATEANTVVSNETGTEVAATTDQSLTTVPTGSNRQSSDLENESAADSNADASAIASNDVQAPVVPEISTAAQTTGSNTVSDNTTVVQESSLNETISSDLVKATTDLATTVTASDTVSQSLTYEAINAEQILVADQDIIPETGSWTFHAPFYARAATEASAAVLTTYEAGDVIDYTGTVVAGGDIWLKNQSAAGVDQYTAVLTESGAGIGTSIIPLSGNWTFHATYYGYAATDTTSEKLATYHDGDEIHYTGTKVGENKIWLEYKPTSGTTQYIAVLTDAGKSIPTSILPMTGSWTFHAPFYGYASADTSSNVLATYIAGEEIQYTGITVANDKVWLEYQPTDSAVQYIAVLNKAGVGIATSIIPDSGNWTFHDTFYGYETTNTDSNILATYNENDEIHYSGVKVANGDIWLTYQPASGSEQYIAVLTDEGVAIPTSMIPMSGTWKLDDPCNAYATLDINTTPIKEYQAGESITYTSIANAQNYTWLVVVNTDGSSEYLPVLVRDNR